MVMARQTQQVIATARIVDLLLVNPSMADDDLRRSMVGGLGAPPWVRHMGTAFLFRDACGGDLVYAVVPPADPEIRLFETDQGETPTFEGPLSGLGLEQDEQREVWRSLFVTAIGAWADDAGNSVSLKLDP